MINHNHTFIPSNKNGYEICADCGTYHSVTSLHPDEIYINNEYWGVPGRSGFPDQIENMTSIDECGISKVDRVLQFVPDGEMALEIGCAPGIMLKKLIERGYNAMGIEPSQKYIAPILKIAPQALVVCGYFPQIFLDKENLYFDCIIGLDVFEHVEDGKGFIEMIHQLLKPNGTAILMSPIIYETNLIESKHFVAEEHCWLYTKTFLEPYLKKIFKEVKFTRWILGHEIIVLTK